MKTTIASRLSKDTKNLMKQAILNTKNTGDEHGFILCSNSDIHHSKEGICRGNSCEINLMPGMKCEDKTLGFYHVHPWYQAGKKFYESYNPAARTIPFDMYLSVSKPTLTSPIPSVGDLTNAVSSKAKRLTEGTTCVSIDFLPNRVECYTVPNALPRYLAMEFVDIAKKWDIRARTTPRRTMIQHFDIEYINLEDDVESVGQKTYDNKGNYIPKSRRGKV